MCGKPKAGQIKKIKKWGVVEDTPFSSRKIMSVMNQFHNVRSDAKSYT
jgi:hypothetical protein